VTEGLFPLFPHHCSAHVTVTSSDEEFCVHSQASRTEKCCIKYRQSSTCAQLSVRPHSALKPHQSRLLHCVSWPLRMNKKTGDFI